MLYFLSFLIQNLSKTGEGKVIHKQSTEQMSPRRLYIFILVMGFIKGTNSRNINRGSSGYRDTVFIQVMGFIKETNSLNINWESSGLRDTAESFIRFVGDLAFIKIVRDLAFVNSIIYY